MRTPAPYILMAAHIRPPYARTVYAQIRYSKKNLKFFFRLQCCVDEKKKYIKIFNVGDAYIPILEYVLRKMYLLARTIRRAVNKWFWILVVRRGVVVPLSISYNRQRSNSKRKLWEFAARCHLYIMSWFWPYYKFV